MAKHSRSGDVNLRPIKKLPDNLKEVKHNGEFILARGEATGSVHKLVAERTQDLNIMTDESGKMYFQLFAIAKTTHTKDHEPTIVEEGIYEQIAEREIDWFAEGVERKVID
jgi:hypothetical protein